jgi:hypothetical protein
MNSKKILYIDMDNVLVDFASGIARLSDETKQTYEGNLDDVPGIFSLIEPISGFVLHKTTEIKNKYRIFVQLFY